MSDSILASRFEPLRAAFVGETSMNFGMAASKSAAIAYALCSAGLKPGDTVAVATSRGDIFYTSFAACFACAFPVAVIDPTAGAHEFELMLRKASPSAVIADTALLQRFSAGGKNALPRHVLRVDPAVAESASTTASATTAEKHAFSFQSIDELERPSKAPVTAPPRDQTPAYMIFTSGTTSNPKAVLVSRGALRHHVATLSRVFGYNQDARLLHYLPTHHTDGLVHGVAASLMTGMTVVHPGPFDSSVNLFEALRTNDISHFLAVPALLAIIRHHFGDTRNLFQFDGFRHLISTAGYLDSGFWQEFQDFFGVRVANFYGMTETVSGSLYCGPDDDSFRIGTVGKPVDARVRIVDEIGAVMETGKIGELQISGDHLMSAYLDDPGATRATVADGWLSTGDLFFQDTDGFFHIVGRKKNIIKRGGISVYPEDIRRVVIELPGVIDAEVIGQADTTFEEIIVLCAVVEGGITADDLRSLCRRELAKERQPDRIILLQQLPRGPSGKVQRDALILEIERNAAPAADANASIRSQVFELAAEIFATDRKELDDTSSPDSLESWDSYAGMEFVLALEKAFEVRLGAKEILRIRNIGQALEVVSAAIDSK